VPLLSPADSAALNAAVANLRAWGPRDALEAKARAGGRRNAMIARRGEASIAIRDVAPQDRGVLLLWVAVSPVFFDLNVRIQLLVCGD